LGNTYFRGGFKLGR